LILRLAAAVIPADHTVKFRRIFAAVYIPVAKVVREVINPRECGWVQYFRWGNAARDLSFASV